MLMGVTRIRYLLDQWRLRSVAVGLRHNFGKEQPPSDWKLPIIGETRRKSVQEPHEETDSMKQPPI